MKKHIYDLLRNKYFVFCIITIIGSTILYFLGFGKELYGDGYGYSLMADEFINQGIGNFRLKLEPGTSIAYLFSVRGYAWPLIIALFKIIGFNTRIGYTLLMMTFYTYGFYISLPDIIESYFEKQINAVRRTCILLCTLIFFPGLLRYPLSDIPALLLVVYAVYLAVKMKKLRMGVKIVLFILAGILGGLSYYVRTGAIISIILVLLGVFVKSDPKLWKRGLFTISMLIGIFMATLPQCIINANCNGRFTYKVPISFTTGIADLEYENGVKYLRYWTNISQTYPDTVVLAEDDLADSLFEIEGYSKSIIGPKELIYTAVKHPNEFLGIIITKLVNTIDTRYGEVYIYDWGKSRWMSAYLNVGVWVLCLFGIAYQINNRVRTHDDVNEFVLIKSNINKIYLLLVLGAPGLFHLLGTHVEERYFFPCFVVLWCYVFMVMPIKKVLTYIKKRIISFVIVFVFIMGVCYGVWNISVEKIPYYEYFYQKKPVLIDRNLSDYQNDDQDIIGVVNIFEYDEETRKLYIYGNCFSEEFEGKRVDKKIVFAGQGKSYVFDINDVKEGFMYKNTNDMLYLYSEFSFASYLFDLEEGQYHIYIEATNAEVLKIYDTLYNITIK